MTLLQSPSRILVVPLRYIGDTVLTVPLIRNLRQAYPQAKIDVLTSRTAAPLLEVCPDVSQVLIEPKGFEATKTLLLDGQYDAAFILRKSFTMALLCRLAEIPLVVGYDKQRFFSPIGYQRWGLLLDHAISYPVLKTSMPQARSHLRLLEVCGIPIVSEDLVLWTTPEDETAVEQLLQELPLGPSQPIAMVHATSASHGKTVGLDKFVPALQRLHSQGYALLCTGTEEERFLYEQFARTWTMPFLNLAGKTTLRQTVALLKRTHVLLSIDSGPIHMAAAVGVPNIIGVYGPTNEKQWAPFNSKISFRPVYLDLPCRPCEPKRCPHNRCKVDLPPENIVSAVESLRPSQIVS